MLQSAKRKIAIATMTAAMMLGALTTTSCGGREGTSGDNGKDSTAVADNVLTEQKVEGWYKLFIDGKYKEYVKLIEAVDGKPDGYAEQMVTLLKMRHKQQEDLHQGPKTCKVVRLDRKNDKYCEAYIELTFNDGAKEEFLLPMVKANDSWRIK